MNSTNEQTNEVVNLSPPQEWLYKCNCPKCISGAHFDKEIAESYRKRGELNNEVARLRELLNRAAALLVYSDNPTNAALALDIHDELDRPDPASHPASYPAGKQLAPAPEEPETSAHTDKCVGNVTEPEWRDLGPDEVICEEDEVDLPDKGWSEATARYRGTKAGKYKALKFRTRRPLPTTNCKQISSKLVVEPKQEKTPPRLDAEIKVIDTPATYSVTEARHATADAIRYLCNEIQKLKNKTHYHHESYCRKCNEPK